MEHAIKTEGFGVRLRPVQISDAAFIVWLRNLEHAKGRVGDSATDTATQEQWLQSYFRRAGDYYFIIETAAGTPVGTYGIYDVKDSIAESGRWVIRPDVPAAIPSAILAFDTAFGRLDIRELRVTTISTNHSVLSLNRKFGFRQIKVEHQAQLIGGKAVDLVKFEMTADEWSARRERLLPPARLAEVQVTQWERGREKSRTGFQSENA